MNPIVLFIIFVGICIVAVGGIFAIAAAVAGALVIIMFFLVKLEICLIIDDWKAKREKKCKEKRASSSPVSPK